MHRFASCLVRIYQVRAVFNKYIVIVYSNMDGQSFTHVCLESTRTGKSTTDVCVMCTMCEQILLMFGLSLPVVGRVYSYLVGIYQG
jgi:hypothetical protein